MRCGFNPDRAGKFARDSTRWEHERAIEEAKHLERFHPMSNVRVVREEYDPQTGLADELTVYASPRRAKRPSPREPEDTAVAVGTGPRPTARTAPQTPENGK